MKSIRCPVHQWAVIAIVSAVCSLSAVPAQTEIQAEDVPVINPIPAEDFYEYAPSIRSSTNLLLTESEVRLFNQRMHEKHYVTDPLKLRSPYSGSSLEGTLKMYLRHLNNQALYNRENQWISERRRTASFRDNMALEKVQKRVRIRYGLVYSNTPMRVAPSSEYRMAKKNDFEFDVLQMSFLQVGEPVAILHLSRDVEWYFVISGKVTGWIKKDHVRMMSKRTIQEFYKDERIIIADAHVTVYRGNGKKSPYTLYMGHSLPYVRKGVRFYIVRMPVSDSEFELHHIPISERIIRRPLSLTTMNVSKIILRMIGEDYNWGSWNGNTDCSSLFSRVFSCFGIELPLGSISQIKTMNKVRFSSDLNGVIRGLPPFASFFYTRGHIMMFIGEIDNKPYVLHNTWKYYDEHNNKVIIGQVVITDLDLGAGSREGSLKDRITRIGTFMPWYE